MAKCRACKFFVGDKRGGECHRNPPVGVLAPTRDALGNAGLGPSAFFPPVTTETWCGEFVESALDMTVAKPGGVTFLPHHVRPSNGA